MENIKQNQERCPICGSPHFIKIDSNEYQCENCGFLKVHNEELSEEKILVINAYSILRQGNYVDAEEAFDDILNKNKNNYEALWGKICSHHGIVFVEDNNKIYPTFHDIVDINFLEEEGFKRFLSICPEKLKEVYINLAKRIEDLRDKYYKQVLKEKPYDIFISFKASDEKGSNTKDYIEATNLHSFLVGKGYKVFFSPVSLKDKTANEYEPYIYHALRTAKVMIVYGQKEEYFEAKWLKNEWGRFIRMIDEGIKEDGSLIICYDNMNPNNLPNRLKKLQCLNLSDKTSYITLDKVLNKLINEKKKIHTIEEVKIEKREIKKVTDKKLIKPSIISLAISIVLILVVGIVLYMTNSTWKVITEPTKTEEGIIGRYVFGKLKDKITIPNLNGGEYNIAINKEATCEEEGIKTYTYEKSGKKFKFTCEIPAKGHDFDSWNVDITPTTKESGQITRICKNDSKHIETIELPILDDVNYTLEVQKEATCTEEGKGLYTYKKDNDIFEFEDLIPVSGENHNYDSWKVDIAPTTKESGQITRICKNDNHIEIIGLPSLDDENYTIEVQKEATCAEEGRRLYTFKIEDDMITFEDIIPTKDHNYINFVCNMCRKQVEYYIQDGYYYFGSYPQTIKDASVNIISIEKDEYGYYTGSDGEKYALLKANPWDSYTFSNGEKIVKNKEYYFKVEPIKWKILENKDGKAFLFSELILDAHRFDYDSNNYSSSGIRSWLNSEFYNKTFTDKQKELIENMTLKDISNVTDKVFLLSEEEIENASYGFNSDNDRCKKVTDYAKANHAYEGSKNGWYWLRTPSSSGACDVIHTGYVYWSYVYYEDGGVAPALSFCKAKA